MKQHVSRDGSGYATCAGSRGFRVAAPSEDKVVQLVLRGDITLDECCANCINRNHIAARVEAARMKTER